MQKYSHNASHFHQQLNENTQFPVIHSQSSQLLPHQSPHTDFNLSNEPSIHSYRNDAETRALGNAEEKYWQENGMVPQNAYNGTTHKLYQQQGHRTVMTPAPLHVANGSFQHAHDQNSPSAHPMSPMPPKSPKNYSFQRSVDYSPRNAGPQQFQQGSPQRQVANSEMYQSPPPDLRQGDAPVMMRPLQDQFHSTEQQMDRIVYSTTPQRPSTASTRLQTASELFSTPPQRVGSAVYSRGHSAKSYASSPMGAVSPATSKRTPIVAHQQRSVVPPSVHPVSRMDFERLASIMKFTSKVSPRKGVSDAPSTHNKSSFSSTRTLKKKAKKKKSTKKDTNTEEIQTDAEFVQTYEFLKEQNSDLESRLIRAENETMLWKARFHAYKNETDSVISELQQKQQGFKTKVKIIQEKNANLDTLHREHEKQVARLNDSHRSRIIMAQQSHKLAMADLRKEYDIKLQQLQEKLTKSLTEANANIEKSYAYADQLKEEIKKLKDAHELQLERMRISDYRHQKEIEALNKEFKKQIEAVHEKYQQNAKSARLSHENILESQKKQNQEIHDKLREEFEQKMSDVKRSYDKQIEELKQVYETELLDLKYKYDEMITAQKKEHDTLFVELKAEHERQIQELKSTHESMLREEENKARAKATSEQESDPENYTESSSEDFLKLMRHLIQLNERNVHEYHKYIDRLEENFQEGMKEALRDLPSGENSNGSNILSESDSKAVLSVLMEKHRILSLQIQSVKNAHPEEYDRMEESFRLTLEELQQDSDRTKRMVKDLQNFANRVQAPLRSQTETTILHVQSQYADVLENLQKHVNVLFLNEQKWKVAQEARKRQEIAQMPQMIQDKEEIAEVAQNITTFDSRDSMGEAVIHQHVEDASDAVFALIPDSHSPVSHTSRSTRKISNSLLYDDTNLVLQSISSFVMEDPLRS